MEGRVRVQSPWLKAEYGDAIIHPTKQRGTVEPPGHDDRIQAMHMALWAAHDWTQAPEPIHETVQTSDQGIDWQRRAPPFQGERISWRDAWASEVDSWS